MGNRTNRVMEELDGSKGSSLSAEEYMKLPYRMEVIPDAEEGGYTVIFLELPGCLTCGETIEEAMQNAEDAKREWILSTLEDNQDIPMPKQIS